MTKRIITLEIDCGERTCASEPGKFCPYTVSRKFGQSWFCNLFKTFFSDGSVVDVELFDHGTGWLQRCQACIDAEQRAKRTSL
jgi:hypothetical protein